MTTRRNLLRFLSSAAIAAPAMSAAAPARGGLGVLQAGALVPLEGMVEGEALAGFYKPLQAEEPINGAVERFCGPAGSWADGDAAEGLHAPLIAAPRHRVRARLHDMRGLPEHVARMKRRR